MVSGTVRLADKSKKKKKKSGELEGVEWHGSKNAVMN